MAHKSLFIPNHQSVMIYGWDLSQGVINSSFPCTRIGCLCCRPVSPQQCDDTQDFWVPVTFPLDLSLVADNSNKKGDNVVFLYFMTVAVVLVNNKLVTSIIFCVLSPFRRAELICQEIFTPACRQSAHGDETWFYLKPWPTINRQLIV